MVVQLDADHPYILTTLNMLGRAYRDSGSLAMAIELLEGAHKAQAVKLGTHHSDTLGTLRELAMAYRIVGDHPRAIELLDNLSDAQLAELGAAHPSTLETLGQLAVEYREAGQLAQAIAKFQRLWELKCAAYSVGDRRAIDAENHLGWTMALAGKYSEAEEHLLASFRAIQQADNVPADWLAIYCDRLASLYLRWGKPDRAESWQQQKLAAIRSQFGNGIQAIDAENHLGWTMALAGNYSEAEKHLLASFRAIQQADNVPADWLATYCDRLADLYARWGKPSSVESWLRQKDQVQLGLHLLRQERFTDAETILRECLAICDRMEPNAWRTFHTKSLLGGALLLQKKYTEAELMLDAGYKGLKADEQSIPPQAKSSISDAIQRLVDLYDVTDKPNEAAKWRKELEAAKAETATP
jgi:tetratricopeptide (TPR) repeat protein